MAFITLLLALLAAAGGSQAVTVYGQQPIATETTSYAPGATYTGLAAYDPRILDPPPLPDPLPPSQFGIQLSASASNVQGLSIPLSGAFFGFSVEMSVVTQVIGLNGSFIHPPFLNLMALVAERAGRVHVRVGGNTQDTARLVQSLEDGKAIEKQKVDTNNPTQTPALLYTPEILYLLSNISSLVNVKWYLGVPLNDTSELHLEIAEWGERILGENLLGLQVGNEPDLYQRHGHRPEGYGPYDYFGEFGQVLDTMRSMNLKSTSNLIGPSVATGDWRPEDVWNTGFIQAYSDSLAALTVERYPDDNCAAIYQGFGEPVDPQVAFPRYLNHTAGSSTIALYLNSTNIAQQAGFPGISTSFGAALWAIDYGLQMGYSNFSNALLHVGGQNVYYNPFTAPPTNESSYHQWTVGPIFYSVLAVAETLGSSNNSQLIDLQANGGNIFTPGYAVYENGNLARLALLNFMTDPSGANDYTATIAVGGGESGQPNGTPAQVKVKYLRAPSVGDKWNVTWGGQTLGGQFEADGRLQGELDIQTVQCDQNANTCEVKVPAPGFALVFMSDDAMQGSEPASTATFATTAITKAKNTVTVDPEVLATSNGHKGMKGRYGSTSAGSNAAPRAVGAYPSAMALLAVVMGAAVVRRAVVRNV
ncbi:Glycoside Hydrolase Family 79 protein [Trametes cinnabarina]|uniref:Glycoside Hydrolase Family 79 protein n=1 Tax=Pycnoporus cinnabarinus TaxID=5643 RepID=A0A060SZ06_PYCCI|nr:Glycoside Hydrolase Family 79 protein [Trametes cinnabarina]